MELRQNGVDQFGAVGLEEGRKPVKLIGLCFLICGICCNTLLQFVGEPVHKLGRWDDLSKSFDPEFELGRDQEDIYA